MSINGELFRHRLGETMSPLVMWTKLLFVAQILKNTVTMFRKNENQATVAVALKSVNKKMNNRPDFVIIHSLRCNIVVADVTRNAAKVRDATAQATGGITRPTYLSYITVYTAERKDLIALAVSNQ